MHYKTEKTSFRAHFGDFLTQKPQKGNFNKKFYPIQKQINQKKIRKIHSIDLL